jgi:hypothetical protein
VTAQDFKDEYTWLRYSLLRLRIILRYAKDSRAESGLRELTAEAESASSNWRRGDERKVPTSQRRLLNGLINPSRLGRPLEALAAFCKEVTVPGTFSARPEALRVSAPRLRSVRSRRVSARSQTRWRMQLACDSDKLSMMQ